MQTENMLGYRGHHDLCICTKPQDTLSSLPTQNNNVKSADVTRHCLDYLPPNPIVISLLCEIYCNCFGGHTWLSHVFVWLMCNQRSAHHKIHALHNHHIVAANAHLLRIFWTLWGANSVHFLTTIASAGLLFDVLLVYDTRDQGRNLIKQFWFFSTILSDNSYLFWNLQSTLDDSHIHGYIFHSYRCHDRLTQVKF